MNFQDIAIRRLVFEQRSVFDGMDLRTSTCPGGHHPIELGMKLLKLRDRLPPLPLRPDITSSAVQTDDVEEEEEEDTEDDAGNARDRVGGEQNNRRHNCPDKPS